MSMLDAALAYQAMGYSVIPVIKGGKEPHVKWKEFQTRKATRDEIITWWTKWPEDNVGIVTGSISNLNVVDLDRYKPNFDPDLELELFPETFQTPTSISPRGGNHIYLAFNHFEPLPAKADVFPGIDIRTEGNFIVAPPSCNGNGKQYEWIKGLELGSVPLADPPESFLRALQGRGGAPVGSEGPYKDIINVYNCENHAKLHDAKNHDDMAMTLMTNDDRDDRSRQRFFCEGRRDEDLFHLANVLVKARCNVDFIKETLFKVAAECHPPFPLEEAKVKIISALDRAAKKTRNLAEEVREFVLMTSGDFTMTDVDKNLILMTRDDKQNASQILSRLRKEGLIEKVGNKNACYRLVDTSCPTIEIKGIDTSPYPISFPLGVHELVTVHKSNIIILAGESNSGKTGFCLSTAKMNRGLPGGVNYLSSEMAEGIELAIRLKEFSPDHEIDDSDWAGVTFKYRADNFPDVIMPDALNIVDYLDEGGEEIYKMSGRIKAIGRKLVNGIAIICIQKHSAKQFGYGGEGTKNAARLYMTITGKNRLTIEKGKIWRNKLLNPNGAYCDFTLAAGWKFQRKHPDEGLRGWILK